MFVFFNKVEYWLLLQIDIVLYLKIKVAAAGYSELR